MRLDRLLASLAVGSRQEVKALIKQGRVSYNGAALTDPAEQVEEGLALLVDGEPLDTRLTRHLMMHKPVGILTAARDARQQTVMDLLPPVYHSLRCMPVGRLDKDTSGLLLFTTDGETAHRLLSPRLMVDKVYEAQVSGRLDEQDILRFAEGIQLSDFRALPAALEIVTAGDGESLARATVQEGKYHQVRRMFGALGHEVLKLKRLRFGALALDEDLAPGDWRELSEPEWDRLKEGVRSSG